MMIHPLANVHPDAKIDQNVTIEPFTTIYADVEIGEDTWIGPNVTIFDGARIGKGCKIYPGAVISALPQDLKYNGEQTFVYIGDHTVVRECVTINKGTSALGYTKIGQGTLIMATSHIAHDCVIGNHCIIVNGVAIAGHVEIDDYAIIGGLSPVHQFSKIGKHSLVAGGTLVRKDVPPYVKAARNPISYVGINSLGLRRRGFSSEKIAEIQSIYRILFQQKNSVSKAVRIIENEFEETPERNEILRFIKNSSRGIMRGYHPSSSHNN